MYRIYYSHITKTDGRPTLGEPNCGKSADVGMQPFWHLFWSADDFVVEAPKLKVSLTDPPIFMGFVIGKASGDGRPMIAEAKLRKYRGMVEVHNA